MTNLPMFTVYTYIIGNNGKASIIIIHIYLLNTISSKIYQLQDTQS